MRAIHLSICLVLLLAVGVQAAPPPTPVPPPPRRQAGLNPYLPPQIPWRIHTVDTAGDVGQYSSLTIIKAGPHAGDPFIAYYDATNRQPKYAHWRIRHGGGWRIEVLDPGSNRGHGISVDSAPDEDWICAAYQDRTDPNSPTLRAAQAWPLYDWWYEVWDSLLQAGHLEATSVKFWPTASPGGVRPVAAYHAKTGFPPPQPAWGMIYRDPYAGERVVVDEGKWTGYRCSLAFLPYCGAPNGGPSPAIAYTGAWGELKYAVSHDGGLKWTTKRVPDTGDDCGWHVSLAAFPCDHPVAELQGQPAIAYQDSDAGTLKFAWHDVDSGWQTTIVDAGPEVGAFPSLIIDPLDGQPVISYTVGPDDDPTGLGYAYHADDYDFTDGWRLNRVRDEVGTYTSLASLQDLWAISYYDPRTQDLKLAVNGDVEIPRSRGAGIIPRCALRPGGPVSRPGAVVSRREPGIAPGSSSRHCGRTTGAPDPDVRRYSKRVMSARRLTAARQVRSQAGCPPGCWARPLRRPFHRRSRATPARAALRPRASHCRRGR